MPKTITIPLCVGGVDVTDLAELSTKLVSDLCELSEKNPYLELGKRKKYSIRARFVDFIRVVRRLINRHDFEEILKSGLKGFIENDFSLLKLSYSVCINKNDFSALLLGLRAFTGRDITRFEYSNSVLIKLSKGYVEVTDIGTADSLIVSDLRLLANSEYYSGKRGHSNTSMNARFRVFVRAIRLITKVLVVHNLEERGLGIFRENNFELLKSFYLKLDSKYEFNELRRGLTEFYEEEIPEHKYIDNLVPIYFPKKKKWRHIDVSELARKSPRLALELAQLTENELELIDQKNYDLETLHSRLMKIHSVSVELLSENFPNESHLYGFNCLALDNNAIQKFIFADAQQKVKNKTISVRTGATIQGTFRWLMETLNMNCIDCYRISFSRLLKHEKRRRVAKTYTDFELREIVFYLEKAISNATTIQQKVSLLFARIQLKTCWNASPMSNIELSDIVELEVAESKRIQILVQKNRANYRVDCYGLDGRALNSVMHDIKTVIKLTECIREPQVAISNYLFVYSEFGKLKRVDNRNIVVNTNKVLSRLGCSVRYDSMKIRKNGSNHIYHEVCKKINDYVECFNHSFEVFLNNYFQVEEAKSINRLHYAVNIMQKYFTGRKISKQIKILTDTTENFQSTPCGQCASQGDDEEAIQYIKEHYSLNKTKLGMKSWCADYLACIWCRHFRTVADADHVWQLLSYKEFVLADMSASLIYSDEKNQMREVIQVLAERVESILNDIALLNKNAVVQGKELIDSHGLHPYWEFTSCRSH